MQGADARSGDPAVALAAADAPQCLGAQGAPELGDPGQRRGAGEARRADDRQHGRQGVALAALAARVRHAAQRAVKGFEFAVAELHLVPPGGPCGMRLGRPQLPAGVAAQGEQPG